MVKKVILAVMMIVMAVLLVGCYGHVVTVTTSNPETGEVIQVERTEYRYVLKPEMVSHTVTDGN